MNIVDKKTGKALDINIVFSFVCPKNKKKYIAFDFQKHIFDKNSTYNNLDILEVSRESANIIEVSEINDSEWNDVKYSLQHEIFSNIKNNKDIS